MVKFQSVGQVRPVGAGSGRGRNEQDIHNTERLVLGKACSWLLVRCITAILFPNGRA